MAFRFMRSNLKDYPTWLRDGASLKQLPGVYLGVLGQVQLQPEINGADRISQKSSQLSKTYMNQFTDTDRVHQLLTTCRLSDEKLATIWAHVNQTFPGKLTNREVCLALALIALFQKHEREQRDVTLVKVKSPVDLFDQVKLEKKPPIPSLYPVGQSNEQQSKPAPKQELSLIDVDDLIDSDDIKSEPIRRNVSGRQFADKLSKSAVNLIDTDCADFEDELAIMREVWLKYLDEMRNVFKRSFDVLNVEHSRKSAIEALKSDRGQQFARYICQCYPIAHNIKFKINELFKLLSGSFDAKFLCQIDDLMTSINEYWAVLINLLHESNQTKFIEIIMDGLNYDTPTITGKSANEIREELFGTNKICRICYTNFYLLQVPEDAAKADKDALKCGDLLTVDKCFYYHARCANFWLHNAKVASLPFERKVIDVLQPGIKFN